MSGDESQDRFRWVTDQLRKWNQRIRTFVREEASPRFWIGTASVLGGLLLLLCLFIGTVATISHQRRVEAQLSAIESDLREVESTLDTVDESQEATNKALNTNTRSLDAISLRNRSFEGRLADLEDRRSKCVEVLRNSTLSLGVKFQETSGREKVLWKGTGFVVRNPSCCVTAAHVLEQLNELKEELARKELEPKIIGKTRDGTVFGVINGTYHPQFPNRNDRLSAEPALFFTDIGLFQCDPPLDRLRKNCPLGIELCVEKPMTSVGNEIAVAGFPTEVAAIEYADTVDGNVVPTIKFGTVERLSAFDTRLFHSNDLVQHNIPLVGGFSGGPIINLDGQLVAITTESSYRMLKSDEVVSNNRSRVRKGPIRLLDAADVNFAVCAVHLKKCLDARPLANAR
jgi:S1-C subfamily serine protease